MNNLLGKSNNFNYKKENGHYSWNRHCIFVSESFVTRYVEYIKNYWNHGKINRLVEDNNNFDKWKASLELNSNPNYLFDNYFFKNEYQFQIMATTYIFIHFLESIKYRSYKRLSELFCPLKQIRIIVLKDQEEDMILSEKLYKAFYGTKGEYTTVYPGIAHKVVSNKLLQYYTETEIDEIFKKFEKDDSSIIKRNVDAFLPLNSKNEIEVVKFENCYEYDMNAAYFSALVEIFPKLKDDLINWYEHRHDNNDYYKRVINYYIGTLTITDSKLSDASDKRISWTHPKTRHWIVDHITNKMMEFMEKIGGTVLYANTDGFIVQNPKIIPDNSDNLGEFSLEAKGDLYIAKCYKNKEHCQYTVFQLYNELNKEVITKGTIRESARKYLDLKKNKYVTYSLNKIDLSDNQFIYKVDNIEQKKFK